jgi:two-component system, NtrC family, sensor kinase
MTQAPKDAATDPQQTIADLQSRLGESLARETATAEVMRLINGSPGDLAPIFDAILEKAHSLCGVTSGGLELFEGDLVRTVASRGLNERWEAWLRAGYKLTDLTRPIYQTGHHEHIPDLGKLVERFPDEPNLRALYEIGGFRTFLALPLVKDGLSFGRIVAARSTILPFTDRQIALLQSFADQAVIAIENVRLFDEAQARTRDLTEALTYQTGSANILRVIASSPTDVGPVLQAIVESACELCDAEDAIVHLRDGDSLRHGAHCGPIPHIVVKLNTINRNWVTGRSVVDKVPIHVLDMLSAEGDEFPETQERARRTETRTYLAVPLLREGESIGAIVLRRTEVHPFSDKQIALLQTFADQAVIAIENARLFNETSEALERQTATAEILASISSSSADPRPVFEAILRNLLRLFGTRYAIVVLVQNDILELVGIQGEPGFEKMAMGYPRKLDDTTFVGKVILEGHAKQVVPVIGNPEATLRTEQWGREFGFNSLISVPLMQQGKVIGGISTAHRDPVRFTEKQVDLIKSFADQAVIAIENTRLLQELRARTDDLTESLQQQTATADVLKAISRSAFDLESVLQTLVESARRLLSTDTANIYLRDGDVLRVRVNTGMTEEFHKFLQERPAKAERGRFVGRAFLTAEIVHLPDVLADPEYSFSGAPQLGKYRAVLGVPMVRNGRVEGVFGLGRSMPGRFTVREIELVRTFADQALIAIENVRLFDEVQSRTRDLAQSLDDLRAAQDRLVQTEKLASLGQLTAGIAHEIKNPLNFVNNFSALSAELIEEMKDMLSDVSLDTNKREDLDEITQMLKSNLDKVVQHGKRADSIVKNMLLHSRQGSGEHRPVDINAIVDESLNLAYHGARAENTGFNITMHRSFDPAVGMADGYPQEITRALLNLISNGFYAATKRKADAGDGFEPTLTATTRDLGDRIEIRIRDNGTGIPADAKEKIFNPFFTTKPAGEGTGLGLSMSHDIIVKQHGGTMDVDTMPGVFTEFKIVLPRAGASVVKPGERP